VLLYVVGSNPNSLKSSTGGLKSMKILTSVVLALATLTSAAQVSAAKVSVSMENAGPFQFNKISAITNANDYRSALVNAELTVDEFRYTGKPASIDRARTVSFGYNALWTGGSRIGLGLVYKERNIVGDKSMDDVGLYLKAGFITRVSEYGHLTYDTRFDTVSDGERMRGGALFTQTFSYSYIAEIAAFHFTTIQQVSSTRRGSLRYYLGTHNNRSTIVLPKNMRIDAGVFAVDEHITDYGFYISLKFQTR